MKKLLAVFVTLAVVGAIYVQLPSGAWREAWHDTINPPHEVTAAPPSFGDDGVVVVTPQLLKQEKAARKLAAEQKKKRKTMALKTYTIHSATIGDAANLNDGNTGTVATFTNLGDKAVLDLGASVGITQIQAVSQLGGASSDLNVVPCDASGTPSGASYGSLTISSTITLTATTRYLLLDYTSSDYGADPVTIGELQITGAPSGSIVIRLPDGDSFGAGSASKTSGTNWSVSNADAGQVVSFDIEINEPAGTEFVTGVTGGAWAIDGEVIGYMLKQNQVRDLMYDAADAGDWATAPPATVGAAIDRLAAALATELGTPIA